MKEGKKKMRTRIHSAVISGFLSLALLASIYHHLFQDLFTIDQIRLSLSPSNSQDPNLSILEPSSPPSNSQNLNLSILEPSSPPSISQNPNLSISESSSLPSSSQNSKLSISEPSSPPSNSQISNLSISEPSSPPSNSQIFNLPILELSSPPSKFQNPNNPISESPIPPSSEEERCGAQLLPRRDPPPNSILFPDWEVVVVVSSLSHLPHLEPIRPYTCLFRNGNTAPSVPGGVLPFGNRAIFRCLMPLSYRFRLPFLSPALIDSAEKKNDEFSGRNPPEMLRWTFVSYESLSTEDDVILFAKGVNSRQGVNLRPALLNCTFDNGVKTAVTHSFQEVFRCPHPDPPVPCPTRISLEIGSKNGDFKKVVPSVAVYKSKPRTLAASNERSLLCACTVVYNVAKFLKEWVMYHSRIGVEKFVLYDNFSDDDLQKVVGHLVNSGYDVTTFPWPWPKTQEAGFSHCATRMNDTCTWIMYVDVDEFVFSPSWQKASEPSKQMLQSLLTKHKTTSSRPSIGQIWMSCLEFGPSNRRSHPKEGVTQGYTCRTRKEQRHKSIVRLDAIDTSLMNVVHHFDLRAGFRSKKVGSEQFVVNHYKYQAWPEFKVKFRRRVSAYVFDWRDGLNPKSKDRAPGLGNKAVEPEGWPQRFCEVNDTQLRDVGRTWFGLDGSNGNRLAWQDE